ncbi:MAG TPA: polysaccharide deacetylase family protein [Gaiellaceae bacterium]|nr:polysaccharide deacetylase family protein [Gaiellaceae bacterium]
MRTLVLCYHAVATGEPQRLAVSRDSLESKIRSLLRRGYVPVTAADAVERHGRLFHVTFDDAYRSVVEALPFLLELGVPATIFACTSYARDGRPFDVPELRDDAAADPDAFATMNWAALRDAASVGVEIASHTVSHPHLPQLSDAELDQELRDSKAELEDELGAPCRHLAYPYGEQDDRVREAARRAGYDAAFAVAPGRARSDPFALPRHAVYRHDSAVGFRLRTSRLGWRFAVGDG